MVKMIHKQEGGSSPGAFREESTMTSLFTVNGKPFFSIGGQTHNSSTCTKESMERAWRAAELMGLNTIAAPITWEAIEPEEGTFCFDQVDWVVEGARSRGLKAVLLWFGTWKNGTSHYAPAWVKTDKERFLWCRSLSGALTRILSPHGQNTMEADQRAFAALMSYVRSINTDGTVVAVQVENEPGLCGTPRDYSPEANALFAQDVPAELMAWLRSAGDCPIVRTWRRQGSPEAGSWRTVFGPVDCAEIFSAYYVSGYCNSVAVAGRSVYPDMPLYCNVWLGEMYNRVAGVDFPSGGATSRMIDLWKLRTPDIDVIAPDVYLQDLRTYDAVCSAYARPDNLLYIPESGPSILNALNVFTMIEKRQLTGIHTFGIDSCVDDNGQLRPACKEWVHTVRILTEMKPLLEQYIGTDKLYAVAQYEGCSTINLDFGDYLGRAACYNPNGNAFAERAAFMDTFHSNPESRTVRGKGLIIDAGDGVFYIAGEGFNLVFTRKDDIDLMTSGVRASTFHNGRHGEYISVEEGHFDAGGRFVPCRRRCGDESDFGIWTDWDVGVIRVVMDRSAAPQP